MKRSIRLFAALCIGAAAAALIWRAAEEEPPAVIRLETAAEREAWLNLRGWRVGAPEESETQMPYRWQTPAGQRWLALQHAQGLSPEQYGGCRTLRCVYPVENAGAGALYAELLLCDGILAGAQVYNADTQLMQSVR